jgi:2-C-methyl-D-erythritol 4-phosphate cytidylyltransferase/2-C-methyl-D-erythritol 2,4-cyclodiphosphate synthase
LCGRPVLRWSIEAFQAAGIAEIVVAMAPEHADFCRAATDGLDIRVVSGGATRTASVRAGLTAITGGDIIHVHDAARPGLSPLVVAALMQAIEQGADGAVPALPMADSLRRVDGARIVGEVERDALMRVQTPQSFRGEALRSAYAAIGDETSFTDDIAVMRARGGICVTVPGDPLLMKLTYPDDFAILERMMISERIVCVGNGVDAHRFGDGDHVTLCGVHIPHTKGLIGHSDADAGWHALVDAILGALGAGDIGAHFPPSDPKWKGADSERFLRHAVQLADAAGARIVHVDVTLLCERPKIGPHRERMRQRTADVLGLPIDRVSVKATTTERMGFLGREEGLAAQATATLDRPA